MGVIYKGNLNLRTMMLRDFNISKVMYVYLEKSHFFITRSDISSIQFIRIIYENLI